MRKKRIMIIGPSRSGKTTLANWLNEYEGPLRRTQDVIYGKKTIDIPSSYIENAGMYKHIISISQDASYILLLVDSSKQHQIYSPGFAKSFQCPVIGVITKMDLKSENEALSLKELNATGVEEPYYRISALKGIGTEALKEYLFSIE